MNYRGRVLTVSLTGESGSVNEYICTAHYCDHIEVVPTCPGTEGLAFPPIPVSGPRTIAVVYDVREDADLIRRVKERCASALRGMENETDLLSFLFPPSVLKGANRGLQENLARLESLDGDQPATVSPPAPSRGNRSALDRVFEELLGGGNLEVVGKIEDSIFMVPKPQKPMIGEHPDYTGKLVFIEIPLAFDEHGESGEYIVVKQSPNSLYVVRTTCCHVALEVVRIPFESETGKHKIVILDDYQDDDFIRDFIERLDDMDAEDYKPFECDLAETVSRQLSRMLEKKDSKQPEATERVTGRMNGGCEAEDRLGCGCGCGL